MVKGDQAVGKKSANVGKKGHGLEGIDQACTQEKQEITLVCKKPCATEIKMHVVGHGTPLCTTGGSKTNPTTNLKGSGNEVEPHAGKSQIQRTKWLDDSHPKLLGKQRKMEEPTNAR